MHTWLPCTCLLCPTSSHCQDRSIFPLGLTVTRLSGTGHESVFMGVMRCVSVHAHGHARVLARVMAMPDQA
jgi:hypothetical protein